MTLADGLGGIVREETQVRGAGDRIDPTLAGVHEVDDPGAVGTRLEANARVSAVRTE